MAPKVWLRRGARGVLLLACVLSAVPLLAVAGVTDTPDWLGHSLDVYAALHPGVQVLLAAGLLVVGLVAVWGRLREHRSAALLSQIAQQMQDGMTDLRTDNAALRAEVSAVRAEMRSEFAAICARVEGICARVEGLDHRLWDHVTEEEG